MNSLAVSAAPAVCTANRAQRVTRSRATASAAVPAARRAAVFSGSHGIALLSVKARPVTMAKKASPTVAAAATGAPLSKWDTSRWITGFTPNNAALRLAVVLGAVAAASQGSKFVATTVLHLFHELSFATWFGSMSYTTFVVGIALFKNVPRQTFRDVQEVLFPRYFQLSFICIALQLALAPQVFATFGQQQITVLGVSMASTLLNLFWLEPETTKVMKERAGLEKMSPSDAEGVYPEGKDARLKKLGGDFGKFHGMSSLFNLVTMGCSVAYARWFIGL